MGSSGSFLHWLSGEYAIPFSTGIETGRREMSSTATPDLVNRKGRAVQINPIYMPSGRISTPNAQGVGHARMARSSEAGCDPGWSRGFSRTRAPGLNFPILSHFRAASLTNMPGAASSPRPIALNALLIYYFNDWALPTKIQDCARTPPGSAVPLSRITAKPESWF